MGTPARDRPVATRTPFTAIDAAYVALHREPPNPTPRRARVLEVAARLWCRQLEFPTVRAIAGAMGHTSSSTPLNGFGHMIDVQAGVIRREWDRIESGWISAPSPARARWLASHVRDLHALHPACLRLPGLVSAAVVAAAPEEHADLDVTLAPLHALAAFAERPLPTSGPGRLVLAATLADPPDLAVPA